MPTCRLRVFRTSAIVCPRAHSASHRLRALSRVLPNSQGLASTRLLPRGLVPLQRYRSGEATCSRFASPGYLRPQGFSPSRRLDSSPDLLGLVSCRVRSWGSYAQPFRSGDMPKHAPKKWGVRCRTPHLGLCLGCLGRSVTRGSLFCASSVCTSSTPPPSPGFPAHITTTSLRQRTLTRRQAAKSSSRDHGINHASFGVAPSGSSASTMAWCTSRHDKTSCRPPLRREVLDEALCRGPASVPHLKRLPTRNTSPPRSRDVWTTTVSTKRRAVGCQLAPLTRLCVAARQEIRERPVESRTNRAATSYATSQTGFRLRLPTIGVAPSRWVARVSTWMVGCVVSGGWSNRTSCLRHVQEVFMQRSCFVSTSSCFGSGLPPRRSGLRPLLGIPSARAPLVRPTKRLTCVMSRGSSLRFNASASVVPSASSGGDPLEVLDSTSARARRRGLPRFARPVDGTRR
jgi:hypothetical protein